MSKLTESIDVKDFNNKVKEFLSKKEEKYSFEITISVEDNSQSWKKKILYHGESLVDLTSREDIKLLGYAQKLISTDIHRVSDARVYLDGMSRDNLKEIEKAFVSRFDKGNVMVDKEFPWLGKKSVEIEFSISLRDLRTFAKTFRENSRSPIVTVLILIK